MGCVLFAASDAGIREMPGFSGPPSHATRPRLTVGPWRDGTDMISFGRVSVRTNNGVKLIPASIHHEYDSSPGLWSR